MSDRDYRIGLLFIMVLFFVLIPFYIFAQESAPVPVEDIFKSISDLVKNYKGMKGIAIASSVLMVLIQVCKTEIMGRLISKANPFLNRVIITVCGQICGILMASNSGMSWLEAVITGLLTSGGAVAIYEAIKPLLKKKLDD